MLTELPRLCSVAVTLATILWQRSARPRRDGLDIGKKVLCLQYSARLKPVGEPPEHADEPQFD
jgi:hypothetical protein